MKKSQAEEPLIHQVDDADADGSLYLSDNDNDDDDDDKSAVSHASSSQQTYFTSKGSELCEKEMRSKIIQQREDAHVKYARNCVMIVVMVCAAAVSIAVFFFALRGDEYIYSSEVCIVLYSIV
jgi:hypothetical protein